MPVEGVAGSDAGRTAQVRAANNSDEVRNVEQRRVESENREVEQARQATESGRGDNVDVTV